MKTATLHAVLVDLRCPYCGEAQDNTDKTTNWSYTDLADLVPCKYAACDCCGKKFQLPVPQNTVVFEVVA